MLIAASILMGVVAYELHKRQAHSFAFIFDIAAVIFIVASWR